MSKRNLTALLVSIAVLAAAALYFIFDPAVSKWAPKCAFKSLTGWECPGCGSQRMIHALLHGDFTAAWHANAILLCLLPLLILMLFAAYTRTRYPRLYALLNSMPVIIAVSAILVGWGIIRNLI